MLMLIRETTADYYENHTNPINTLSGRNTELLIVNPVKPTLV
jgi:hypothetical protein